MKNHNCDVYAENLKNDQVMESNGKTVNSNERRVTFAPKNKDNNSKSTLRNRAIN